MDKSGVIVGSVIGAVAILIGFTFLSIPVPTVPETEFITNNSPAEAVDEFPVTKDVLSLTDIFEQTESGVVSIRVQRPVEVLNIRSEGSGFVYDTQGHIITNAHVINNAEKITVTFLDGRSYNAKIIGLDTFTDLGVIKVNVESGLLHPLPIGDSSRLKVGEAIAAIGNPFGLSGSMTSGIISQIGRLLPTETGFQIPDVIQTDAAINPGNSGGPLLNMRGEVVGITTAIQSGTGDFAGVGFAIPTRTVIKIIPELVKYGEIDHPWIGISGRDIDPDIASYLELRDARGFLIATVVEGSAAAKAGLHGATETVNIDGVEYPIGGDIILSVDDIPVRKIDDILIHLQREKSVGDELVLEVLRDGRTSEFVLVLDKRPN